MGYERLRESSEGCPKQKICHALFRRAYSLIPLINKIKEDHEGLSLSKKKNLISDDVWDAFKEAEVLLEAEVLEVQEAATELLPKGSPVGPGVPDGDWGDRILQEAAQYYWNDHNQEAASRQQEIAAGLVLLTYSIQFLGGGI